MVEASLLQLSIFSFGAVSFAGALFAFTLALSLLRQQRLAQLQYPLYDLPLVQRPTVEIPILTLIHELPTTPRKPEPIPEDWRIPIQAGTPDQIIIEIKPDDLALEQPVPG